MGAGFTLHVCGLPHKPDSESSPDAAHTHSSQSYQPGIFLLLRNEKIDEILRILHSVSSAKSHRVSLSRMPIT